MGPAGEDHLLLEEDDDEEDLLSLEEEEGEEDLLLLLLILLGEEDLLLPEEEQDLLLLLLEVEDPLLMRDADLLLLESDYLLLLQEYLMRGFAHPNFPFLGLQAQFSTWARDIPCAVVFQMRIESKPISGPQQEKTAKNMREIATMFLGWPVTST